MREKEFLFTILIQNQADKRWELRKFSIKGLPVDAIPNSQYWDHKNVIADSKENYEWDL